MAIFDEDTLTTDLFAKVQTGKEKQELLEKAQQGEKPSNAETFGAALIRENLAYNIISNRSDWFRKSTTDFEVDPDFNHFADGDDYYKACYKKLAEARHK